jgi:hypothetical protein
MEIFTSPAIWLAIGLFGIIMVPILAGTSLGGIIVGFFQLSDGQFGRDQVKRQENDAKAIDKHATESNNWEFPDHRH